MKNLNMNGGIEASIIDQMYAICKPKDIEKELETIIEQKRKLTVLAENLYILAVECLDNPKGLFAVAEVYKELGYNNLCGVIMDDLHERFPLEFHDYITKSL